MFADILLFNYSLGQAINIPHTVLMLHTGDYIFNVHAVIKVTKLNNGCNICTASSLICFTFMLFETWIYNICNCKALLML